MNILRNPKLRGIGRRTGGAATVEFALVAMLLFTLIFGIVDFSRWLLAINSAVEATRGGARLAAVCSPGATGGYTRMLTWLPPGTTTGNITVNSVAGGTVTVELTGVQFAPVTWILPRSITLPAFRTTIPSESLSSSPSAGQTNPDC